MWHHVVFNRMDTIAPFCSGREAKMALISFCPLFISSCFHPFPAFLLVLLGEDLGTNGFCKKREKEDRVVFFCSLTSHSFKEYYSPDDEICKGMFDMVISSFAGSALAPSTQFHSMFVGKRKSTP